MSGRLVPTRGDIEASANAFRAKYAPGQIGALDIERIIEVDLGITLVPVKNLCRAGLKASVSHGGTHICVDAHIYRHQPDECRQVLTHETGHIVRHRDLLPQSSFADEGECREFHSGISEETIHCIEWEAWFWTGYVLVPRRQLEPVFDSAVSDHYQVFREAFGRDALQILKPVVADLVADRFGVAASFADTRIRRDGLWGKVARRYSLSGAVAGGAPDSA